MIDRFAVRRNDQGYGVWDAAVHGWHSARDLDESEATRLATAMNAQADAPAEQADARHTRHAPLASRRVDPPRRVLVLVEGTWWPGRLDWWVREPDGWFGRAILDSGGPSSWFPAKVLRPAAAT